MTGIEEIKKSAHALGACGKVESINSIEEAVKLLMTPQGREFAVKTGFPPLETWRKESGEIDKIPEVLLDTPKCTVNGRDLIAVGNTELTATYTEPDRLHHITVMHGARVTVVAKNYAVVTVSSYDAEVKVKDDGKALVYVEEAKKKGEQK